MTSYKKIVLQTLAILLIFVCHQWFSIINKRKKEFYSEILSKVGNGTISKDSFNLTPNQIVDLKNIINANPNNYNAAQKAIIQEKSGAEILTEIGMGTKKSEDFKLSKNQYREIDSIIKSNPNNFNAAQKLLLK